MKRHNALREQIGECKCLQCKAVVSLVERGAKLRFSPNAGGRLCELAVVAASGAQGIAKNDVVAERRRYAQHLGIELSGPTSNSDKPNHITWALSNSNHTAGASNRINLGRAKASFSGGRFFLY
jgi:hypothetical protein